MLSRTLIYYHFFQLILISYNCHLSLGKTYLRPDGNADNTYELINNVLGGTAYENPDCAHPNFGRHITQKMDKDMKKSVFAFYIHVTPDDDKCEDDDRQRNEIKTYGPSRSYLKGLFGDSVSFSWSFKLDSGFLPASTFTHLHQIKAGDGDNVIPLITLTPRTKISKTRILELIHVDSKGVKKVLKSADLKPFLGKWVHVTERLTYSSNGKYSVTLRRLSDRKALLSYSSRNIDLWREETTFVRPKWGIYRSLEGDAKDSLRNEIVFYDQFCLAKGKDKCI